MSNRIARLMVARILRSGGAVAAAFAPTDIPGLVAWYDFSDLSTLWQDSAMTTPVASDGDVIGAAQDKSGNDNHAVQATTANKPVYKVNIQNGLSVSQSADGSDGYLLTTPLSLADFTVFWVGKSTSDATRVIVGASGSNVYGLQIKVVSTSELVFRNATGLAQVTTNGYLNNSWWLGAAMRVSNALTGRRNGADVTTGTPSNTGAFAANSAFYASDGTRSHIGPAGELLIYENGITAGDITNLETYLNDKWAVYA